jgi:hypothetical protein
MRYAELWPEEPMIADEPECEVIGSRRVDSLKMCSCATCGLALLAFCEAGWFDHQRAAVKKRFPMVFVTISGRPYCHGCRNK